MSASSGFVSSLMRVVVVCGIVAACHRTPDPAVVPAQREQEIASGLKHQLIVDPAGPWRIHIVEIDLINPDLELEVVRAHGMQRGRERTSSMVRRTDSDTSRIRVAVNADFFDLATGENENNLVINGEWWKGLPLTESPYDTYDAVHGQVAVDDNGGLHFGRFILDAQAWNGADTIPILMVNSKPQGRYEGTALYTGRYGSRTPSDTGVVRELRLKLNERIGDTLRYTVLDTAYAHGNNEIPANGAVLSGYLTRAAQIAAIGTIDTVRVVMNTWPRTGSGKAPRMLTGGWPLLIVNGADVSHRAATLEATISRNAEARHPRTAIAVSKSGKTAWLVAVDGRDTASVGMTLVELSGFLRKLGAWNALNFDGGGSTTMIIDGRVVNKPTDSTGEREVGNALVVRQRAKR